MDISKFKVGDRVIVTKRYDKNMAHVGMEGTIVTIDRLCPINVHFEVAVICDNTKLLSWCKEVEHIEEKPKWDGTPIRLKFI